MPTQPAIQPATQRVAILKQLSRPSVKLGDVAIDSLDPSVAPMSAAPEEKKTGISKWAKIMYGSGLGADVGSTVKMMKDGNHEGNPLINWAGDKAAIPIGAAMEMGGLLIAKKLFGDKHPKIMSALLGGAGLLHGAAAVHNLKLPKQDTYTPSTRETIVYDTGNGGFIPPK